MAALIPGLGPVELLIMFVIFVISVGVPIVVVLVAMRSSRSRSEAVSFAPVVPAPLSGQTVRCAVCDSQYSGEYDACPYCARKVPAQGSLDVTSWGTGWVRALFVATLWPILYIFISIGFVTLLIATSGDPSGPEGTFPVPFAVLMALHLLTIFLGMALTVVYVVIAVKSPIPSNAKVLWAVAAVMAGMLANPIIFYFLVWEPRRRVEQPNGQQGMSAAGA